MDLSDEALDRFILARLEMAGVDLSVLPEEDENAPADQVRILRSARAFLRSTVPAIAQLSLGSDGPLPVLYPIRLVPEADDILNGR